MLIALVIPPMWAFGISDSADQDNNATANQSERAEVQEYDIEFIWPVEGSVTTSFGSDIRRERAGKSKVFHAGVDIAAKSGTSVLASASGKVIHAKYDGGRGNAVMIEHG